MKNNIFSLMFFMTIIGYTQTFECGFQPDPIMYNTSTTALSKSTFSSDIPIVFNVKFLVINNPYSVYLTEDVVLKEIAKLNINFNAFNIFYKYRGIDFINIDFGANPTFQSKINDIRGNEAYSVNNINILVFDVAGSAADFSNQEIVTNPTTLLNLNTNSHLVSTLTHECGHLVGLFHTFHLTGESNSHIVNDTAINLADHDYDGDGYNDTGHEVAEYLSTPNFYYSGSSGIPTDIDIVAENVTRDITDPNYNANFAGDLVIDTPAQFRGSENNYFEGSSVSIPSMSVGYHYIPHPSIVDQVGDVYDNIDLQNFMTSFNYLKTNFTNGQGVRMREMIENNPNIFDRVKTDIASLYEPYKIETIGTISDDIHSLTDNGDGTAEVCKLKTFVLNHYFQPGFDYSFYQGNVTNITHQVDKDDLYGILDEGILRYVKINQINPSYLVNIFDNYTISYSDIDNGIIFYEPSACLRPAIICRNEQYSGGKVISTVNLANPNVDIKILTNQEASNPNLEQNLENNKFHIIEKTTISGVKIQKTIYKSGN